MNFGKICVNIFELYKGYKKLFSSLYNNWPELQGTIKVQKVGNIQLLMKKFLLTFMIKQKFLQYIDRKMSFVHGKTSSVFLHLCFCIRLYEIPLFITIYILIIILWHQKATKPYHITVAPYKIAFIQLYKIIWFSNNATTFI